VKLKQTRKDLAEANSLVDKRANEVAEVLSGFTGFSKHLYLLVWLLKFKELFYGPLAAKAGKARKGEE
jgi:hypothetical protein